VLLTSQRLIVPELLDDAPLAEARQSLSDLVRINRWFGGYSALKKIFSEFVSPSDRFSVLDVGAASGDMGARLRQIYPGALVTSLDYRSDHLIEAADPRVAGDAFQLPFRERSFDFVFSSLFLHHFTDQRVVELLSSFRAIARRAIMAVDLDRGPLAYHFLPATNWLFHWHRLTLHDGPISVAAAFKKEELLQLARNAGLSQARVRIYRPWARISLVAPV
jgi:2-polyprenyl-3-methyl-5-hydroxy-6-metoxy-1,4-benzoquinol methylase